MPTTEELEREFAAWMQHVGPITAERRSKKLDWETPKAVTELPAPLPVG